MARQVKVAAAQMGPINEGTSRDEVVDRMLVLLEQAITEQVELIAYPEMALTTYFPKRIRDDYDQFFEDEVPPKALEPLLRRAREKGVAVHVGFCEKADGHYFNTALLTDETGTLVGTYRKIHLPGRPSPDGFAQVYEVRYFETGDTGYRVFSTARPASASRSARTGATRSRIAASAFRARTSSSSATTRRSPRWRSTRTSSSCAPAPTRTACSWSASPRPASKTAWS